VDFNDVINPAPLISGGLAPGIRVHGCDSVKDFKSVHQRQKINGNGIVGLAMSQALVQSTGLGVIAQWFARSISSLKKEGPSKRVGICEDQRVAQWAV